MIEFWDMFVRLQTTFAKIFINKLATWQPESLENFHCNNQWAGNFFFVRNNFYYKSVIERILKTLIEPVPFLTLVTRGAGVVHPGPLWSTIHVEKRKHF